MAKDVRFASVAIIWERVAGSSICLDKKGIGIHGTDNPDMIGRSTSHGCIRLAQQGCVPGG
jgi:hypothetical protein